MRTILIALLFLLHGCEFQYTAGTAAGVQADFFECPPNNTLVVCAVGTSPPAADMCESVGSGMTTITPNNCG